jgi:hypothetical protein
MKKDYTKRLRNGPIFRIIPMEAERFYDLFLKRTKRSPWDWVGSFKKYCYALMMIKSITLKMKEKKHGK